MSNQKQGMRTIGIGFVVLTVILLCAAVCRYVLPMASSAGKGPVIDTDGGVVTPNSLTREELEQRKLELEKDQFTASAEVRVAKFKSDIDFIIKKYQELLPPCEAVKSLEECHRGIDFLSSRDGICGFGACVNITYKMAYDKIKGTTRTEEAIEPLLSQYIVSPLSVAMKSYERWTQQLTDEIEKERQLLALDLAVECAKMNEKIASFSIPEAKKMNLELTNFQDRIKEHSQAAIITSVEVLVEAAMIKTSAEAVKKVTLPLLRKALASCVVRATASMATGAGTAVADGPLPIGDIIGAVITVGGLSWTAYDIYQVTKTMPGEMRQNMYDAVDAMAKDMSGNAEKNLNECCAGAYSFADESLKSVMEYIK